MKQIIVNVDGLTIEEKGRINEALAKIKNIEMCSPSWDTVAAMYGPSTDGVNVGFDYYSYKNPTHSPQQVLEMAGMTTKRKVRKDFNPSKEYSVDVSKCTEEEKMEVQQAFFDVGITWIRHGAKYTYPSALQYTNKYDVVNISAHNLYVGTSNGSNMTAKEFLELVYEPENKGHVHAELMAQYAEDAKTHDEPWKLWECRAFNSKWTPVVKCLLWFPHVEYRHKPNTHIVNGVEVPDLRIDPEVDQYYWYPDPNGGALVLRTIRRRWSHHYSHRKANNLCYEHSEEGKQAAILHAKAWLGIA